MIDWAESIVVAKQHLLKAENSLNLKRNAEGEKHLLHAMDRLADVLEYLDPIRGVPR